MNTNRPYRFGATSREKLAFVGANSKQREIIVSYLTVYGYPFSVNVYGDILVYVHHNAIELSNLRTAINKLAGSEIGVTFFAS